MSTEKFSLTALVQSAPDADYPYIPTGRPLPPRVDLRMFDSPVEDQLSIGSCVANSMVGAMELHLKRAGLYTPGSSDLSRLFLYYYARYLDNLQGADDGATPRSGCKAAAKFGVCLESTYPYIPDQVLEVPPENAVFEALKRTVTRYERITLSKDDYRAGVSAIKDALSIGVPVTLATRVYEWIRTIFGPLSLHSAFPGAGNPDTDPRFRLIGNHQMLIVGYDDNLAPAAGGSFIVRNSWGTRWGDKGYWAMPYIHLQAAFECWAVRAVSGVPEIAPGDEKPPASSVNEMRQWLVSHGIGTVGADGLFTFAPNANLAAFVTAGAALAWGIPSKTLAEIVGVEESVVSNFLNAAANQSMISAYQRSFE